MRFYYKNKNNTDFLNLKSPLTDENYIQITEEEFKELTKPKEPTAEEKAAQEKARKTAEYKKYLEDTDYVVLKISEAMAEGNESLKQELMLQYAGILAIRKAYRQELNK
jgi:hypothetical protein